MFAKNILPALYFLIISIIKIIATSNRSFYFIP